jgi:hypothetical protein
MHHLGHCFPAPARSIGHWPRLATIVVVVIVPTVVACSGHTRDTALRTIAIAAAGAITAACLATLPARLGHRTAPGRRIS